MIRESSKGEKGRDIGGVESLVTNLKRNEVVGSCGVGGIRNQAELVQVTHWVIFPTF